MSLLMLAVILLFVISSSAQAQCQGGCINCMCMTEITGHHEDLRDHVTDEFEDLRDRITGPYWDMIREALQQMTAQLTTTGLHQVTVVGAFFDAKHQLETQRMFQQLAAEAHKDYHVSEGLCEIGTNSRSLASSERLSNLNHMVLSNRMMTRQLSTEVGPSQQGSDSDRRTRLYNFIDGYCNPQDNADGTATNGLGQLCGGGSWAEKHNKDLDYTQNVENKLTINMDFQAPAVSQDERDIFALSANLYAHQVPQIIPKDVLATPGHEFKNAALSYRKIRSIAAKRSVAQNSFAAITAMKGSGDASVAPYLKRMVTELGVRESNINDYLGDSPSYFAQMEVLTKLAYQDPDFYAELTDKPVNVERKGAALQAIGLMQDRDIYRSLLRSEAVLATLLETLLHKEQARIHSSLKGVKIEGDALVATP